MSSIHRCGNWTWIQLKNKWHERKKREKNGGNSSNNQQAQSKLIYLVISWRLFKRLPTDGRECQIYKIRINAYTRQPNLYNVRDNVCRYVMSFTNWICVGIAWFKNRYAGSLNIFASIRLFFFFFHQTQTAVRGDRKGKERAINKCQSVDFTSQDKCKTAGP